MGSTLVDLGVASRDRNATRRGSTSTQAEPGKVGPAEGAGLELLDTMAEVETPERVRFRYQLAGPGRRALAWLVDTVLRALVFATVVAVVSLFSAAGSFLIEASAGVILVSLFALEWLYGVVFETLLDGRTPGKAALQLRVVRGDGAPVRFADVVLRNLLRAVDYFPIFSPLGVDSLAYPTFAIAIVVMTLDPRLRRIGDLVAGTVVVVDVHERLRGMAEIDPPVSDRERQELPAAVSLSADELRVLEEYVRRRPSLSAQRSEELAEQIGPMLSERTGVRADSWDRVLVLAYARATGKDR